MIQASLEDEEPTTEPETTVTIVEEPSVIRNAEVVRIYDKKI